MKVGLLKTLLKDIPNDADFSVSSNGYQVGLGPGLYRPGAPHKDEAILDGFSAEELRREIYEVHYLENQKIAVIALSVNSRGDSA